MRQLCVQKWSFTLVTRQLLLHCPRSLPGLTLIYCGKAGFGPISRSFSSNSGAILLKRSKNRPQTGLSLATIGQTRQTPSKLHPCNDHIFCLDLTRFSGDLSSYPSFDLLAEWLRKLTSNACPRLFHVFSGLLSIASRCCVAELFFST